MRWCWRRDVGLWVAKRRVEHLESVWSAVGASWDSFVQSWLERRVESIAWS